jgi:WD40 repeat protein/serine/threonine protein kinase
MAERNEAQGHLISLAAEAIGPITKGCVEVLTGPGGAADPPPVKGITYFGPRIIVRWLAELGARPPAEQIDALVRLASLPVDEGRREAAAAVERLAADAAPEDRNLAVEYLTAIPLAARRSLVPDPATGRLTLSSQFGLNTERTLTRLLPLEVPPFPIGTVVAGTSYHLEELLGVGGFGAVYKARNRFEQNQPPRAIKFCLDPSMLVSLHRERAILDRLMTVGDTARSNRIVRLYGYALDVQPPFLVYEFVPGGDLTSYLAATQQKTGRGFRPVVALELIRQAAEALACAHAQGLVHRDLKPANILVSGETIKVTDFGIGGVVANLMTRGSPWTGTAQTLASIADQASLLRGSGTPLYMSAEQRRGDQPDPRHDLYSLGVVWYQLLVGDVTRELHPGWPDELTEEFQTPPAHIELIQRCVGYFKKRPADAGEFLVLLPPPPQRAAAPAGAEARSRGTNGAAPATALPRVRGMERPAPADLDRLKARLAEQIEHDALAEARVTLATLRRALPRDPEVLEARSFLESHLGPIPEGEVCCFREHQGWVRSVAVTPDGRRALSGGDDATLRLWDLETGRPLQSFAGHAGAVMGVAVGANGRVALSGGWDGTVRLWDLHTGRQLRCLRGDWKVVKCVALTPDGVRALFAGEGPVIRCWDLARGQALGGLGGHRDDVRSLAVSADGRRALSGSDDRTLRYWDLETGRELRRFEGHTDSVTGAALAPNGRWVLSTGSDCSVRLWQVENGRELRHLTGHTSWVNSVAIAPDGRRVLTGSGGELCDGRFVDGADTSVRLWDVATGDERGCLRGHTASVTSVALSGDGRHALTGSLDRTVRWWELPG